MDALKITLDNCTELIDDARRRVLSSEARKFADGGARCRERFKLRGAGTIWGYVVQQHERLFWHDIYTRRIARLKRMANKERA